MLLVRLALDEMVNGSVVDTSGHNRTAVCTDVQTIPDPEGKFGTCVRFNGTSSRIEVAGLSCPLSFTFAAWVRKDAALSPGYATLVEFGNDAPYFGFIDGVPVLYTGAVAASDFGLTWNHIVVTQDDSTSRMYVNGTLVATGPLVATGGSGLGIGYNYGDAAFTGEMRDVLIYDEAVSVHTGQDFIRLDSSDGSSITVEFTRAGGDAPALHGWADTSSMLFAALESLNRASAIDLIEQIIQVIDTEALSRTDGLAAEKASLAALLTAMVSEIKGTTTALAASKDEGRTRVDALETGVNAQIAKVPGALDLGVTARLFAQNETIRAGTLEGVLPKIGEVFEQVLDDQRVDSLAQNARALHTSIEQVLADANTLSALELEVVRQVIDSAVTRMNLAPVIQKALIAVNGALVRLDDLVQKLAAKPEVEQLELTYDGENIRGAVFTFGDGTTSVFTAKRIDLPDLAVHYHFRTADLRGLPAEFELRFARTTRTVRLGDRDVAVDDYEAVHQSTVLFSIRVP